MLIGTNRFAGIAPRVANHLKADDQSAEALDVDVSNGSIVPFRGLTTQSGVTVGSTDKTIYRSKYSGLWDSYPLPVDVVRSPIANDGYDRAYWVADGDGQIPYVSQNWDFVNKTRPLGVPKPEAQCVAVVNGAPPEGASELIAESRAYLYTFVSDMGEEGPPSLSSAILTIYPDSDQTVTITIPNAPRAGIVAVNIYRTNSGSTGTEYQFVDGVAIAGNPTYVDSMDSKDLGVVLPSSDWLPPLAGMRGLINHPGGFLAGFSGRELCLSEKFLPHAWPIANRYPVDDTIVGIAAFGTSILIMTTSFPLIATGDDPSLMTIEKLEVEGACLSKRGIVDMGYFVIYPSIEGLIGVGVGSAPVNLTEGLADRKLWESINPSTMIASRYGDKYVGITSNYGFIFDPRNKTMMPISLRADALFYDDETSLLYVRRGTNTYIEKYDSGTALTGAWTSKEYRLPYPMNFGWAHVFAENYPVTVDFYAGGETPFYTKVVANAEPFRLPAGTRYEKFQYKVTTASTVTTVMIATIAADLAQV